MKQLKQKVVHNLMEFMAVANQWVGISDEDRGVILTPEVLLHKWEITTRFFSAVLSHCD